MEDRIDFVDGSFWGRPPNEELAWLRANAPVFRDPNGVWGVSTYELIKYVSSQPAALTAVKLAANSGVVYGIWKLRRKHPKVALALAIGATGFQAVVVSQNMRVKR